ncbi:MAG TPA: YkgJ family cysteine cluster protein [Planctomycetota bacterium]|nr:YkgJ family cysteine cluster protein [Planctomycetota bacterium]
MSRPGEPARGSPATRKPGVAHGPGPARREPDATADATADATPDAARDPARDPAAPWWFGGLRFECTACGKCCENHGEGFEYVYSTRAERRALAVHLGITERAFEAQYCERIEGHLSFKSVERACVFLKGGRCSVYALRPSQCRTFPFWPELLTDERTWQRDVASFCPGAGQGPVRDANAIRAALRPETGP